MPEFDYVIVGAGSAGCVLANRLSADPAARVLVLESGGADDEPNIHSPMGWGLLLGTEVDWSYSTVPQSDAAFRRVTWPRGRVLGGSSALNAMVFMRGSRHDYDSWSLQGNIGWDYQSVLQAFRDLEHYPAGDPDYRGTGGPLKVSLPERPNPLSEAFIDAAIELGHPRNEDFNAATLDGVGWNQLTVWEGRRQSAAVAFLAPVISRSNLTVETRAHVQRLVIEPSGRVSAVEYVRDGREQRVEVTREAIVSAGSLESPKILMLSGVGPAEELRGWGLPIHVNLPGVGRNLHDHPGVSVTYESKQPIPPGNNQLAEVALFAKVDPAAIQPQVQYGFVHAPFVAQGFSAPEQAFSFYPSWAKPKSRGWVRLQSASPMDPPLCNPNYLQEPADLRGLLEAIELSRDLAHSGTLREWAGKEAVPGPTATDKKTLTEYIRRAVDTWFHPVGTCRMGVDSGAVVDPQLRVHGTENLRVVDASVMPEVTTANTNAPTLMIAWRAAQLIKEAAS